MAYERSGDSPIDYLQCRYGKSKLLFRGPKRDMRKGYYAFIGGTETYGKYIEHPFPALLEQTLGKSCVNLGAVNAGVDAIVNDPTIVDICSQSKCTIIQITGAQNMSNRFYSVHPRRNDRFIKASKLLETIFREVDFSQITFTRHLLTTLKSLDAKKFSILEDELKEAWLARMENMLKKIQGRKILLYVSDQHPQNDLNRDPLGMDPLFVDQAMIEKCREFSADIVEVKVPAELSNAGLSGMQFPPLEIAAAREMYGPKVHQLIAEKLQAVL